MSTIDPKTIQLLTPKDAAKLLAISERTLWALADRGAIPRIKLGNCVRYRIADLDRALSELSQCSKKGRV
jgi:excisionase family DNA binding protein